MTGLRGFIVAYHRLDKNDQVEHMDLIFFFSYDML